MIFRGYCLVRDLRKLIVYRTERSSPGIVTVAEVSAINLLSNEVFKKVPYWISVKFCLLDQFTAIAIYGPRFQFVINDFRSILLHFSIRESLLYYQWIKIYIIILMEAFLVSKTTTVLICQKSDRGLFLNQFK